MELIDFSLEGSNKASLLKALTAFGNQILYDLIDENNVPTAGVTIVVNVPPGSDTSGIPDEGYHIRGPFVHKPTVFDVDGETVLTPAVTGTNWKLDIRLSPPASNFDRDGDGVDEISKSKIKTWMKDTGVETVRSGLNDDHPGSVTYYEKSLAGGDWVRLYWNVVFPKHEFFGGRFE